MGVERPNNSEKFKQNQDANELEIEHVIDTLVSAPFHHASYRLSDLVHLYEDVLKQYCVRKGKVFFNPFDGEESPVDEDHTKFSGLVEMYGETIAEYDGVASGGNIHYHWDNLKKGVKRFVAELNDMN